MEPVKPTTPQQQPQNEEVRQRVIDDLVGVFGQGPERATDYLGSFMDITALLERADDPIGEQECVLAIKRRHGSRRLIERIVRVGIRELCHYPPEERSDLVHAAWRRARETVKAGTLWGRMERRYSNALRSLDPRSKALLRIISEINDASEYQNDADFLNAWGRLSGDWPVDPLRGDPAFAELLQIFDAAEVLNEANL